MAALIVFHQHRWKLMTIYRKMRKFITETMNKTIDIHRDWKLWFWLQQHSLNAPLAPRKYWSYWIALYSWTVVKPVKEHFQSICMVQCYSFLSKSDKVEPAKIIQTNLSTRFCIWSSDKRKTRKKNWSGALMSKLNVKTLEGKDGQRETLK